MRNVKVHPSPESLGELQQSSETDHHEEPARRATLIDEGKKDLMALTWNDLSYHVIEKTKDPVTHAFNKKTILSHVFGSVRPGELLAVMGPSGSGKTTLLDLLANRIGTGEVEGDIFVNGKPRGSDMKHYAAYVQQEDTLVGTMTVYESLMFSARLTCPAHLTREQIEERVQQILTVLGLKVCEHVRIGNIFLKGISGGQKRRVSIGVELLKEPRILFLDEPTSGLDSASAFKIVEHLNELAQEGHSIICTIHQPSSEVFQMFTKFMLLVRGKTMYFGPQNRAVDYFASIGFPTPQYSNPADYFIFIVNTDFIEGTSDPEEREMLKKRNETLIIKYKESRCYRETIEEIDQVTQQFKSVERPKTEFSNSFFNQFLIICGRKWKDNLRNPAVYWVRLAMFLMLSLMIGSIYWQVGDDDSSLQDRSSLLFFADAFLVFMSIAVVPAFIEDRATFVRERSNGYYGVSAYVVAETLVSIPGILFISLACTIPIYFMSGLNSGGYHFMVFLFDLFLSLFVAEGMLAMVAAIVPHYIIGMALGAGIYGMFMICQGYFVLIQNIPPWWKYWAHYWGFHTYSFEIFMYNEFHNRNFKATNNFPTGEAYLSYFSLENADIGLDFGVLIIQAVGYRFLYYLILSYFRTGKR